MSNNSNLTTSAPIYLLGETTLSIYLAFLLDSAGEKPLIITAPQPDKPEVVDITIKEAQNLKKHKFSYTCQSYTFTPGKLLLITSSISKLKSELMLLSPKKLSATPSVIFSSLEDVSIAETLLGKTLIRGYFDGWLQNSNQTITLLGNTPKISLVKNYTVLEDCLSVLSTLQRIGLESQTAENDSQIFWEHFAVQFLGSVLSASSQQNIYNLIKSKDRQREIEILAVELAQLAQNQKAVLNPAEIITQLQNIPMQYTFPAQKLDSETISELNHYYRFLINQSSAAKIRLPKLNSLMKEIYFRINSF